VTGEGGDRVRAVLFDLDGVLFDSYRAWFHVVNDAAKALGAPPIDAEKFRRVWGQGVSADVVHFYPGRTAAEVEREYAAGMKRRAREMDVNPEAGPALDLLAREGIRRAGVTNTQDDVARALVRGAGLEGRFDAFEAAREGVREKPAPDLLLAAMADLGVGPRETLMVGDTRYDEEAAASAGTAFLHYDLREGGSLVAALARRLGLRTVRA
jgi:phosphoglycolate phosphatase